MPIKGISDEIASDLAASLDLIDLDIGSGTFKDGRPWPPVDGPQPWSPLWRRLAEVVARIATIRPEEAQDT